MCAIATTCLVICIIGVSVSGMATSLQHQPRSASAPIHIFNQKIHASCQPFPSPPLCCPGPCDSQAVSSLSLAGTAAALPVTLAVSTDCDGGACECFELSQTATIADLTAIASAAPEKFLVLNCTSYVFLTSPTCQSTAVNVEVLKSVPAAKGGDVFWPAPYSSNCSSRTPNGCSNVTVVERYSCDPKGKYCTVRVPLAEPRGAGEGFVVAVSAACSSAAGRCSTMATNIVSATCVVTLSD